jgi:hypothetical protein
MQYPIETGIPMPEEKIHSRAGKYPWREMRVGDSFLATAAGSLESHPDLTVSQIFKKRRDGLKALLCYQHQRYPQRFQTRIAENGVRVWRVE